MLNIKKLNVLNIQLLANIIHVTAGAAVVWLSILLYLYKGILPYTVLVIFYIIIVGKESLVDPRIEKNEPFFWAGAYDLSLYMLGSIGSAIFSMWLIGVV
jgi:hypothetical protein